MRDYMYMVVNVLFTTCLKIYAVFSKLMVKSGLKSDSTIYVLLLKYQRIF